MGEDDRRVGIFGWGVVAPRSPDMRSFERNLDQAGSWLEPFAGFGPSNFLVGTPEFDFSSYRPWIDARFEPRKFAQLDEKMGDNVKFALGAFIQALESNPPLEGILRELGPQAHVYVGTGLGDLPVTYRAALDHHHAQRRWDRFWCQEQFHPELASYRTLSATGRQQRRAELGAPEDPLDYAPEEMGHLERLETWFSFWVHRSRGLTEYLEELASIEGESIGEDPDAKGGIIRRKLAARKRLNQRYGCPPEPWASVDARLLWNIPNIPAAQISMLSHITGPAIAPVAACSTFGVCLKLAQNAIRLGQAKVVVVGATDPPPHPLSVSSFFNARVLAHDRQVSKPLTGMRGTHVAGGACVWIVGDASYLAARGLRPVGLEILGVGLSSDADHIITPSEAGPREAIREALTEAGVEPAAVSAWDMHATATPGDWTELKIALSVFAEGTTISARKGTFGHGMAVCGGWELTAQHLGLQRGALHPVELSDEEIHPRVLPHASRLVRDQPVPMSGNIAGKISMGIGGINCCVVCRRWDDPPSKTTDELFAEPAEVG